MFHPNPFPCSPMSFRLPSLLLSALALATAVTPSITRVQAQTSTPPPSLSVDAVVSDVVGNNPELKFYEAELTAARADQKGAGRLPNPQFTPAVAQKRTTDPFNGAAGAGVAWTVAVSQPFEWPGRMALRKSIASRQVALAENGLDQFRNALSARARTLAYDVSVALQKAAVADEIAERFLALQQVVVQRDPAGVTPVLESRILEANSITYRRRAAAARQQAQTVLLELNQLRGQPLATDLKIVAGPLKFVRTLAVVRQALGVGKGHRRTVQIQPVLPLHVTAGIDVLERTGTAQLPFGRQRVTVQVHTLKRRTVDAGRRLPP